MMGSHACCLCRSRMCDSMWGRACSSVSLAPQTPHSNMGLFHVDIVDAELGQPISVVGEPVLKVDLHRNRAVGVNLKYGRVLLGELLGCWQHHPITLLQLRHENLLSH